MMYLFILSILQCGFWVHGHFLASKLFNESHPSRGSTSLMELLVDCDGFNSKALFIIGDMDYNPNELYSNIGPTSLILMDEMAEKSIPRDKIVSSIQPNVFIINTKSEKHLNRMINLLKLSSWWNIGGFYIILTPFTKKNCDKSFNYLWIMWKMDLINVTFICHNVEKQILMFTYNPYTNHAPDSWEILNNSQINPPWTLLTRPYKKDPSICPSLFFDKTQKLDGYSGIHAAVFKTEHMKKTYEEDDRLAKMLFRTLNLTYIYTTNPNRGFVDAHGTAHGMIINLTNNIYDIVLNTHYPANSKRLKISSIIAESGLGIVSQPRGYISIMQKIINYFPIWYLCTILGFSIATGLVLKYYHVNYSFCRGMTQVTALFWSGDFTKPPRTSSARIFLFQVYFYILLFQGLARGTILGFLMTPQSKHNMDTFHDLINYDSYVIYCDLEMRKFIPSELRDRCIDFTAPIAMKKILKEPQSCYISDKFNLVRYMRVFNSLWLHMSPNNAIKEHMIFMMRNDWPLSNRIDEGVSRLFESGLSHHVYQSVFSEDIRKNELIRLRALLTQFRYININDVIFCFEIWGVGIVFCLIVFVGEISGLIVKFLKFEYAWLCKKMEKCFQ